MKTLLSSVALCCVLMLVAGCGGQGTEAYIPEPEGMPATMSPEDQAAYEKALEEENQE